MEKRYKRIFLSGCSGVGKTTLAKAASELLGIPYVSQSASLVWPKFGITSHADAIEKSQANQEFGYLYQKAIHENRVEGLREYEGDLITDRGVMDNLIYMGDYPMDRDKKAALVTEIMKTFMEDLESFDCIFVKVLKPFRWDTEDDGKRIADNIYQTYSNMSFVGFDFRSFMDGNTVKRYYKTRSLHNANVHLDIHGVTLPVRVGTITSSVLNTRLTQLNNILINGGAIGWEAWEKVYKLLEKNTYDPASYK